MSDMKRTYKDAINALNSLQSNFASLEAKRKIGPSVDKNEYSIKVVFEFIRRLGYTPKEFDKLNVIHVTGTKGKGSTCAFTESILLQYRNQNTFKKIGLFTSPHLKSVRERIRINGQPINETLFTKYFFEVWDRLSTTMSDPEEFPDLEPCDKVKPMYFKYLTVLSFHIFMSEGVDTAIYEVGVGGKYDSTNIVPKPTVVGITPLGIDHTAMLGNTISSITWNKTGIFKPGVPAFVSEQPEFPETVSQIKERAKELGVSSLEFVNADKLNAKLGLLGDFQKSNGALAVKLAATHLKKFGVSELPSDDLASLPEPFSKGLAEVKWDGRCQIIRNKPGYENITWFIDGAHTTASVDVASKWFLSEARKSTNPKILLFNQQGRENANDLLALLYHNTKEVKFNKALFTTNVTWSTGYNSELVSMNNSQSAVNNLTVQTGFMDKWQELDEDNYSDVLVLRDIELTVSYINGLKYPVDVFVCGSLHLVGGVLTVLDNDKD